MNEIDRLNEILNENDNLMKKWILKIWWCLNMRMKDPFVAKFDELKTNIDEKGCHAITHDKF